MKESLGLCGGFVSEHKGVQMKIVCSEPILCDCGSFPCLNINIVWHFQHVSNCEFSSLLW